MLIIADDLTGALDSAVAFAQLGMSTHATLSMNASTASAVVAVNTDSRDDEEIIARRKVSAVTAAYPKRRIFKKIDLTLRGNFAAELAEILQASGCKRAIVAPAFPAVGRTTRNGVQLVYEHPVHEEYPLNCARLARPTSHIPTLLESCTGLTVSSRSISDLEMSSDRLAQSIHDDPHQLIVCDATTQHHLDRIAKAALLLKDEVILCGTGGLSAALAIWWREAAVSKGEALPQTHVRKPLLMVVGSMNPVTRRQLAHLAVDFPEIPAILIGIDDLLDGRVERFVDEALESLARGLNAVLVVRDETYHAGASREIARSLAAVVRAICEQKLPGALLLTGGDVAQAVCEALGARFLRVARAHLTGMPLSYLEGGIADGLAIITKAGGFGQADVLSKSITLCTPLDD